MISQSKSKMNVQGRSEADGMENNMSFADAKPLPQIKHFASMPGKYREPKFVPYEPYKAAVTPILATLDVPPKRRCVSRQTSSEGSEVACSNTLVVELQARLSEVIHQKEELEIQFQLQTQVNRELKHLLVASLGEDVQTRVQHLIEDKAKLGRELLACTHKLQHMQEQLEQVSTECDLFQSKFQASGVLVDELGRWKLVLSQKLNRMAHAAAAMLKEHGDLYESLDRAYGILRHVQSAFDPGTHFYPQKQCERDVLMLARGIRELSVSIQERLLGNLCFDAPPHPIHLPTSAEGTLCELLSHLDMKDLLLNFELERTGISCDVLPHECSRESPVMPCRHCSGDVMVV